MVVPDLFRGMMVRSTIKVEIISRTPMIRKANADVEDSSTCQDEQDYRIALDFALLLRFIICVAVEVDGGEILVHAAFFFHCLIIILSFWKYGSL